MKKKDWLWVLVPLALVLIADQATKKLAVDNLGNATWNWWIFYLDVHYNDGLMLGWFSNLPPVLRIVSLSTGGAFLLFSFIIVQYLLPTRSMILRVGMSVLMGSILGNVLDRMVYGHVVDFLIVGTKQIHTGVFNVSDFLQWVGYFTMGYAMIKDREKLWPKENARNKYWILPIFQLRYCIVLTICALGFSIISGVFSYTFLKFVVIDLIGKNEKLLNQFLIPFLMIYSVVAIGFTCFLFFIGKQLSHRTAGPIYAFERFVFDFVDGKAKKLTLRTGDELKHLEELAGRISKELRVHYEMDIIPLLPRGEKAEHKPPTREKVV